MSRDEYTVRVGAWRRNRRPPSDLYTIPYTERQDDGRIIVWAGDHTPLCADCGVGHLQWAEAGYVSWHRICNHCGSHWDLHPITWGPARPQRLRATAQSTGVCRCGLPIDQDEYWCKGCDEEPSPIMREIPAPEYARWVDGQGEIPLDPQEPISEEITATWGDLVALLTPEMWRIAETHRDQMAGMAVVPCAWARRARFY